MKPGRELDALVAEKVMGFRWMRYVGYGFLPHDPRPKGLVAPDGSLGDWASLQGDEIMESDPGVPRYSTDISSAWEVFGVVNRMIFSQRRRFWDALAEEAYRQTKQRVAYPDVFTVLYGDMPAVICRAALAAVGPQPPETL